MIKQILSFLLVLLSGLTAIHAQRFDWVSTGGYATAINNSYLGAVDIARDPAGNLYTMDFGNLPQQCQGDTLVPFSGYTTFIYKFNPDGQLIFINRVGTTDVGTFTPLNLETDESGNLYLLGHINGVSSIIVNNDTISAQQHTSILVKMDSDGNYVWRLNTGFASQAAGCMLQYHNGHLYYQSANLTVSKINTEGTPVAQLSATYYTSPISSQGLIFKNSDVFSNGDLLFAATSYGTVAYGEDTLYHTGNPAVTIPLLFLRCDESMSPVWARYFGNVSNPDNNFIPLCIDQEDAVYAGVQVNTELQAGDDVIANIAGGSSGTGGIIKMDANGTGVWARSLMSGFSPVFPYCLYHLPDGSGVFCGGLFSGTAQMGDWSISSANGTAYIAKIDYSGQFQNAFSFAGGVTGSKAKCLESDGNGLYYVGGMLNNGATPIFSCTPREANRGFFLAKFTEEPDFAPTPTISQNINTLMASPTFSGNIQWFLDGVEIADATGNTLEATQEGNYSVSYSYNTGCISSATSEVLYVVPTGIHGFMINNLTLFPNPASQRLYIRGNYLGMPCYRITDLSGKTMATGRLLPSQTELNIETFAPGIYILQVQDEHTGYFKFVKQ